MFERPSRSVVKHLPEGTTRQLKSITSTAACQTAHPYKKKKGRASATGVQDRGVGKRVLSRSKLQGNWHINTLQEAIEYVDHELLTNRFHVTHNGGCAVLFNKDAFLPDVKVKSIYLHDTGRALPDKVTEGDSGCVFYHVPLRRQRLSGQKTFTVLSLHISNIYAKKCGIAKKLILTIRAVMLDEKVDLALGDFNGAAWRCDNRNNISAIEEAFADSALPMLPGPTPPWGPGAVPGKWADVCGYLKPLEPDRQWKVRLHGAFSIPMKLLASARPIKAATTKHGSTLTLSGGAMNSPTVRNRSAPYHYGQPKGYISDVTSDPSLSS